MCFAACSSLSTSTKKDRRVIGINNLSEYYYLAPGKIKGDKFTHFFLGKYNLLTTDYNPKTSANLNPVVSLYSRRV